MLSDGLEHDPEKWMPVSRLREALAEGYVVFWCFRGRRQVGKDHAENSLAAARGAAIH
jgi:hypothetical protein